MAARFDFGRGLVVAAGEEFGFGDDAVAIDAAGNVRHPDGVANELDQFQVERGDEQGDGGIEGGHASLKAKAVARWHGGADGRENR